MTEDIQYVANVAESNKEPARSTTQRAGGKYILLTGSMLTAAVVAFGIANASSDAETTTVETAAKAVAVGVSTPLKDTITEWDEYTGRFVASKSVEVRARVSGYLTQVAFEDGAIIEKGTLLFRVDPRPFKAELAAAKAELASANAALQNAKTEAARGERLVERQALSTEEADRRSRVLLEAEAGWAAAKARVDEAQLNLEFTEIRAPITGRISDDFVSEGNLIVGGAQGGTLLTTLVAIDPIQFEFTASEADYLKYRRLEKSGSRASGRKVRHPVDVKLMDESAYSARGELSFVDNQIDRSTGTMRGRATFANTDGLFVPGMFGRLRLIGSGEYEAVMIPDTAVQTDQSQKYVWVVGENEIAERRDITLGPIQNGFRIVREGLIGTERLIVSGTQFVRPGAALAPSDAGRLEHADLRSDYEIDQ